MPGIAIDVQGVSKAYRIYAHPRHRLFEALSRGRRRYHRDFWALRDVTFQVSRGSTVGIIGMNGSGKSTLLQVVAGIVQPTTGRVAVEGRIASLLELGAGFNPEFTGRENVLMHGALLGFSGEEMAARLGERSPSGTPSSSIAASGGCGSSRSAARRFSS
jgi:lipopolysaccharide transport system ATP-binding protein